MLCNLFLFFLFLFEELFHRTTIATLRCALMRVRVIEQMSNRPAIMTRNITDKNNEIKTNVFDASRKRNMRLIPSVPASHPYHFPAINHVITVGCLFFFLALKQQ